MSLTKLTIAHVPELLRLARIMHAESHYSHVPFSGTKAQAGIERMLASDDYFAEGLVFNGSVRGAMIGCVYEQWWSEHPFACDVALFVSPDARGGLLAKRLIESFKQWCGPDVVKELGLNTGIAHDRVTVLFNHCGFTQTGGIFRCA